jgi:molybdopterin converting factor small subunit
LSYSHRERRNIRRSAKWVNAAANAGQRQRDELQNEIRMKIRVTVSGRGYDSAASVPAALDVAEGTTLDELLRAVGEGLPAGHALAPSCLIAVSGAHVGTLAHHACRPLRDGDEILLIAPVAGG